MVESVNKSTTRSEGGSHAALKSITKTSRKIEKTSLMKEGLVSIGN
jgi:hypothetical protein